MGRTQHGARMPEVSVIIPTMNEEASIGAVIDEVQTALVGWPFEILGVDSDARDRTMEISNAEAARDAPEHRHGYRRAYDRGRATAAEAFVAALGAGRTNTS